MNNGTKFYSRKWFKISGGVLAAVMVLGAVAPDSEAPVVTEAPVGEYAGLVDVADLDFFMESWESEDGSLMSSRYGWSRDDVAYTAVGFCATLEASNGAELVSRMDELYYGDPFFADVFVIDDAYTAVAGLAHVGGCDDRVNALLAS